MHHTVGKESDPQNMDRSGFAGCKHRLVLIFIELHTHLLLAGAGGVRWRLSGALEKLIGACNVQCGGKQQPGAGPDTTHHPRKPRTGEQAEGERKEAAEGRADGGAAVGRRTRGRADSGVDVELDVTRRAGPS